MLEEVSADLNLKLKLWSDKVEWSKLTEKLLATPFQVLLLLLFTFFIIVIVIIIYIIIIRILMFLNLKET